MGRMTAAALVLAIGSLAGCAELTTTGEPADGSTTSAAVEQGAGGVEAETAQIEQFAPTILGMTEQEAKSATEAAGYTFRVVEIDGQPQAVTMDYRIDRVNATINDGRVASVTVG
jgi:outer membrane murein-binding lipoprotein Lpp